MGLKGQLEDLPLIDMLQIIAFSKKSGYLRVAGPAGRGAVVLAEGRVLFAFSWSTMELIRELAHNPDRISTETNRANIEAALRELAGLREGSFKFEMASEISEDLGGVRIKPYMIPGGIDPQELLLDLAVEIDNERREATSLLELAFQGDPPPEEVAAVEADDALGTELTSPPAASPAAPQASGPTGGEIVSSVEPAPAAPTVVLVDDESPVTDVVGGELRAHGFRVMTSSSPGPGADLIRTRVQDGDDVLVAVDLKMPTTSGESFLGGFELIRRLQRERMHPPVLLMVEHLTDEERAQAKALGVRRIVHKPTLTKPDPELYRADLREFTASVISQLDNLIADYRDGVPVDVGNGRDEGDRAAFIAAMTKKLVGPGRSADVSFLVMQVAARFVERGVLFVVKSEAARGLAGFGFGASMKNCIDITRGVTLSIDEIPALTEVVSTGKTVRVDEQLESLDETLFAAIGRGKAAEGVLMPMLYNRATLLLLYGDNGMSGRALGDLGGLELFMAQAGMALENKLLQQKLSASSDGIADDRQGVHT